MELTFRTLTTCSYKVVSLLCHRLYAINSPVRDTTGQMGGERYGTVETQPVGGRSTSRRTVTFWAGC